MFSIILGYFFLKNKKYKTKAIIKICAKTVKNAKAVFMVCITVMVYWALTSA